MESLPDLSNNEYNTALKLNKRGYLPDPEICKCGNNNLTIKQITVGKHLILYGDVQTINVEPN